MKQDERLMPTRQFQEQFAESDRLEAEIKRNFGGLAYVI